MGSIPKHSGMDKKPCSLIVERKTTATNLGFSPYGTGRNLSRTAYKKTFGETPVQEIFDAETKGLDVRFYSNEIDITELPSIYKPEFDFKFHSDRLEKLEFEKKQRSNSWLFRVVLTKKSCFSMRKYRYHY